MVEERWRQQRNRITTTGRHNRRQRDIETIHNQKEIQKEIRKYGIEIDSRGQKQRKLTRTRVTLTAKLEENNTVQARQVKKKIRTKDNVNSSNEKRIANIDNTTVKEETTKVRI